MNWDIFVSGLDDGEYQALMNAMVRKRYELELTEEEKATWSSGRKIDAIKDLRYRTKLGLKEAYDLFRLRMGS